MEGRVYESPGEAFEELFEGWYEMYPHRWLAEQLREMVVEAGRQFRGLGMLGQCLASMWNPVSGRAGPRKLEGCQFIINR